MIARAITIRVGALALALATASCTWFDDGPPSRSCRTDRDCFVGQGEVCNTATLTCVERDAGAITTTEAP